MNISVYNTRHIWKSTLLTTLLVSILVSCNALPVFAPRPFAADCIWNATAQAWVDLNNDGVRDPSDLPLPGVTFHVNDIHNGYSDVGYADGPTDWKGEVQISVWLPGCPKARFEVYADVPTGYSPLSDVSQTADDGSSNKVFEFGFVQLPGMPTLSPRPPSPLCVSHRLGLANRYDITDIDIAVDGTVWVATFNNGLRRLSPGSSDWQYLDTKDGLINNQVRSITTVADGSVWFGTEGGASRWSQEQGWVSYTSTNGLIDNSVYGIAIAPTGEIWFATAEGVSRLDIQTMTWASLSSELVTAIAVSPDGIPWAAPLLSNQARMVQYDSGSLYPESSLHIKYIDQLLFTLDGMMWLAGHEGVGQYNPATGILKKFNRMTTKGAFVDSANALDVAPDGSVWIAATTYTPVVYHFFPWLDTESADAWVIYDKRDGLPTLPSSATNNDTVHAIAVTPSGSVWIATTEHATLCSFEK